VNGETFPLAARVTFRRAADLSDEELVRRTLHGDSQAFDILIECHVSTLYRIVRRMCSDQAEAEAITQEAFLRAWENLPRSKADAPFWPWLVQIAVNAARDALKKSRPLDFADLPEDSAQAVAADEPGPEEMVEQAEGQAQLAAAVEQLPIPYRMVIALRYQAEMSYDEIAAALNLPVNTARTHLRRAKQRLKQLLETDDERPVG
jgi:RNA polymerase sigma-70 factor (ECF subfamily)